MAKTLDLSKSVYELVKEFPDVTDIMVELGFGEIRKNAVLNSVGKLMTIPKGAKFRKLDLNEIVKRFEKAGFEVIGLPESESSSAKDTLSEDKINIVEVPDEKAQRLELLKSYLTRLNNGESLETVRAEFVKNFSSVDASEIMAAEQELLQGGAPLHQVQQLCDVHSALFHGATNGERHDRHDEVMSHFEAAKAQEPSTIAIARNNVDKSTELIAIEGHPLRTFTHENEALKTLIDKASAELSRGEDCIETLKRIREVAIHYAKKGDLLYPVLNVRYGIIGPSQVMWTLDDEIRAEFSSLIKETNCDDEWKDRVRAVLQRAEEMIYKEANILFPVCAANFNEDEWMQIYRDSKDYAQCLGVKAAVWEKAESYERSTPHTPHPTPHTHHPSPEIVLPTGEFTLEQLRAMLNTLPLEITFVDADNINRYFNESPKVFKRPQMALGREVFSCHPPKVEPMVRKIINDFMNGSRDQVPVWMNKNGHPTLVNYMAVRDHSGNYLGTVEVIQDMEFARKHFSHE